MTGSLAASREPRLTRPPQRHRSEEDRTPSFFPGALRFRGTDRTEDGVSLGLANAANARDLGGYPTADGRRVRRGLIYRANALNRLTEGEVEAVRGLRLACLIDLRHPDEVELVGPNRLPSPPPGRVVRPGGPPDCDEGVLGGVLRATSIPEASECQAEHRSRVPAVQLVEGPAIAARDPHDQLAVGCLRELHAVHDRGWYPERPGSDRERRSHVCCATRSRSRRIAGTTIRALRRTSLRRRPSRRRSTTPRGSRGGGSGS